MCWQKVVGIVMVVIQITCIVALIIWGITECVKETVKKCRTFGAKHYFISCWDSQGVEVVIIVVVFACIVGYVVLAKFLINYC
jgi:hypothetical protein